MLREFIKSSNIIELIEEGSNEDASMYKVTLRVVGSPSDYLPSVRKEYYISDANMPTFVWVLVIWGDLEEAFGEIGPVIRLASESPMIDIPEKTAPPPRKLNSTSAIRKRSHRTKDGIRTVLSIPLPFRRGNRDNPGTTRKLGSRKGIGAFVSNTSDGGA
jgi:hypothetical protein